MNPQGNAATLAEARRRDSLDKRQRVLTALTTLEHDGKKVTFTAVARSAGVSTWLTYTEGIREHIEAARSRQQVPAAARSTADVQHASTVTLRTELDLARQEIRQLRQEKEQLHHAVRHQLGAQLDAISTKDLTTRVDELTHHNHELAGQLQQATSENAAFQARVASLEEDLAAARTSLRRMIRNENRS
jgi:hypothetical protein